MVTQSAQYAQHGFADPDTAQHNFAQQFDLREPDKAMSSYQKIMHQHTKQQFDLARASFRRRSAASENESDSLTSTSSHGSISSTTS